MYEAASMQRWNDQIRTVDLTELDKQAHKMIIAYCLGKCEEDNNTKGFDWIEIIEAGIFEFLQRIVITDLKPTLFHRIKDNKEQYRKLNEWAYKEISPFISPLGKDFCMRFQNYLHDPERNLNRRIISAAHFYATKWEFDIIERANPNGYAIEEIKEDIRTKQEKYQDLGSMQQLLYSQELKDFVDICGQLRFQIRWSHLYRVPKTSVLGHMLVVAMLVYLFSLETGIDNKRSINNYFTGLFHDLPEVLTRDVINPVKRSVQGLGDLIKEYERSEMEAKIYKLIPETWHQDMHMFTESEFTNIIALNGALERDGELIKGIDQLAAFIEAYLSLRNGVESEALEKAMSSLREEYQSKVICGIDFGRIYSDFD
ncbi:MAG: HD domain-containing protein [Candidatus Omnitrophica bacterium]|nr:HD domain-containing protein [Candidatus Omnitrophota bacterium]